MPPPPGAPPPPPPPDGLGPPPGYVAYGSAPTPTQRVHRIGGLSKAITVLVAIAGLGGIVNAFVQLSVTGDAEDFLAGRISSDEFNDRILSTSAFSIISGLATLASAIVVMIWMYRIAANLRAYGIPTTWHPLFAIFGWFLPPGVLYVIPLLMLREQWSKSKPSTVAPTGESSSSENPFLWVWWVCFGLLPLLTLALSANSTFSGFGDTSAEAVAENFVDTSTTALLVGAASGIVSAVTWILFSRQLTERHRALTGER